MGLVQFRKQIGRGAKAVADPVDVSDVALPPIGLPGVLRIPAAAKELVVFVHGSGSSRLSPRNRAVAQAFNAHGIATLLFDLLTEDEAEDGNNAFDIALLADRLCAALDFIDADPRLRGLSLGLFGARTGTAAALVAASRRNGRIGAVVSRGGRPDLAGAVLDALHTPTLMVVGGEDGEIIALSEEAMARLQGPKAIEIVPGAGHRFHEPGALTAVTVHAARWFEDHLRQGALEAGASAVGGHAG